MAIKQYWQKASQLWSRRKMPDNAKYPDNYFHAIVFKASHGILVATMHTAQFLFALFMENAIVLIK